MVAKNTVGRGFKPRPQIRSPNKSSNKSLSCHTRPSIHDSIDDSSSLGHQPTPLTPQSLLQHTLREEGLRQNPHHAAATRIEQTRRLQQGLQSLDVDIPSDLYQARVSGYHPYNYNGAAPPTSGLDAPPYNDDDEVNDMLSDEQLFLPTKNHARPLPEHCAMQGMPWTANYFPQNWHEKEVLRTHSSITTQTLAPTPSYSNNYLRMSTSSAPREEAGMDLSHATYDQSTHQYTDIVNSKENNLYGIGEQFASNGAGFERAYQDVDGLVDCGW